MAVLPAKSIPFKSFLRPNLKPHEPPMFEKAVKLVFDRKKKMTKDVGT